MKTIIFIALATLAFAIIVEGCGYVPMTARSKLDVTGEWVVVEKTTTTHPDGTVEVVEKSTTKSPSAGDLELKEAELEGRTKVGTAQAETPLYPSYPYYGGNYFGGSSMVILPHGGGCCSGGGPYGPHSYHNRR